MNVEQNGPNELYNTTNEQRSIGTIEFVFVTVLMSLLILFLIPFMVGYKILSVLGNLFFALPMRYYCLLNNMKLPSIYREAPAKKE